MNKLLYWFPRLKENMYEVNFIMTWGFVHRIIVDPVLVIPFMVLFQPPLCHLETP